jgi:hypothetical protein
MDQFQRERFESELIDLRRFRKFAVRFGMKPVMTDEEIRFQATLMASGCEGVSRHYDSLREIGRRLADTFERSNSKKIEKLFERV